MKTAWSKKEDKILLDNIKTISTRTEAFVTTSKKVGRTEGACGERWRVLKKDLPANFFETEVKETQEVLNVVVEDKATTSGCDIISEVSKIIEENKLKTDEVAELRTLISNNEGLVFDLQFQLSQAQNDKENLEYQVEKFAGLIEASMSEQAKYIEQIRKLESKKETSEGYVQKLETKRVELETLVAQYKNENEKLKKEKEEYMNENNTIMNLFNKARKMFTGTDKDEPAKFKMERNGNLERIV